MAAKVGGTRFTNNETLKNALTCFFNPEDVAKVVAAKVEYPLGARPRQGYWAPGANCGFCFRVANAQMKSYTSHQNLCTGPPRKPTPSAPRLAVPAEMPSKQSTTSPDVKQEAVRKQPQSQTVSQQRGHSPLRTVRNKTPSQCPPALELPDLSKIKITEGRSNHRILHIHAAGEPIRVPD